MSAIKRFLIVGSVVAAAIPVFAAPVTIRLATQAPSGTVWDKALTDLGATWRKDTEGRATLHITPNGASGGEKAVVKNMQVDALDAGLLTAGGIGYIDKSFNVFTIPFFFENDAEELAVQQKLEPKLEQELQAKGFHLLAWGTGGWVQIFSKNPLKTLDDVKKSKLYTSADDNEMVNWYTKNGFNVKPLSLGEFVTQLKLPSGIIDTAPDTPYLALMMGIYTNAKFMLDVHIAPLVGAIIVKTSVWNQLTQGDRDKMTAAAKAMEASIRSQAGAQDADSITQMKQRGLQVITPDAKTMADFRAAADNMAATMRGTMVPEDIFNMAQQERDAVRKRK